MIIFLSDADGDDVAIHVDAIVAVTVGEMNTPRAVNGTDAGARHTVTLVHTTAGPLVVRQSYQAVVDAWRTALNARTALNLSAAFRRVAMRSASAHAEAAHEHG